MFSAVLGYSCYVALVQTDDPAAHITSVASTIALASGYVARNAGRPKFVAVQLLTFCIPMAIGLISDALTAAGVQSSLRYALLVCAASFAAGVAPWAEMPSAAISKLLPLIL